MTEYSGETIAGGRRVTDAFDISIVIVSWNVKDLLRKCLSSIYRYTAGVVYEVFVVDNHSGDGSAEMVRRDFPAVRLIENAENVGFARANNQVLTQCAGRYLLLLNPDTELIGNAFKKMVAFMDDNCRADGLAPRLVYADMTLQPNCRHFPTFFTHCMGAFYLDALYPRSSFFNRYRMGGWGHGGTREVDQPYGACLLIRKTAIDRVGLMDERLFMYYDEVDLCYRIKKSGGKIYFTDTVTVIHHGNASSKQAREACEHYMCASRLLYFSKHYGPGAPYVLALILLAQSIMVWGVFGITHVIAGRPRDPDFFKQPLRIAWQEHAAYFKRGHRRDSTP